MCGIIAIVRRKSSRSAPSAVDILDRVERAAANLDLSSATSLTSVSNELAVVNELMLGVPGAQTMLANPGLGERVRQLLEPLTAALARADQLELDDSKVVDEARNAALTVLKDQVWAVAHDRVGVIDGLRVLGVDPSSPGSVRALLSVHDALSAIDRLEVRGRDSVGLHLFVSDHGLDLDDSALATAISDRSHDPTFANISVRRIGDVLSFVYKHAAEIGELGDNTAALRSAIAADVLLRRVLTEHAEVMVVGHTRWASVGIISEPNAHPINSELTDGSEGPYFVAALNGDVDNYADLAADAGLRFSNAITTDAKIIPTLVAARHRAGADVPEAFRSSVDAFDGSVAIALAGTDDPSVLRLAQRGSGQALYVGLAEDTFVVASEPYGVVELTQHYIRLDGESPVDPTNPTSARGQILTVRRDGAGELSGLQRHSYDGRELPIAPSEIAIAEITTRDIDRRGYPHFLLKEITEAPRSFRTTLLGKLHYHDGRYSVDLSDDTLPDHVRQRLADGQIRRIIGIGQGTASVAARAFAEALASQLAQTGPRVEHQLATELSGFGIDADMSDVLVVAVSQSGTTTDTNRTVDVVRERGATVIAIVNRRNSDLTEKADGVLYTSDGRDVEMSVASTKAFYSQIAAGFLLATAIADAVGADDASGPATQRLLAGLAELPDAMEVVVGSRESIGDIAAASAPGQQYWAIVGSGPNRIAAEEIRIKLSELCYKAIASDTIEDKKHIDLSSEPLILVCAAGMVGGTADDAVKEVAIYRAHKATPIVIASQSEQRFGTANVIRVPDTEPELGFVLSAVVGHLYGYEAALAIDSLAMPMRQLRSAIEQEIAVHPDADAAELVERLQPAIAAARSGFGRDLRSGRYNGQLSTTSAVELALLLRYAAGVGGLDAYQLDFGKVGTPSVVIDDLSRCLARSIDELTRPVDAIKHQAKTVTVGISRSDESLLHVPLVAQTIECGASRDSLTYATLRTLAGLDAAVEEVLGFTRYRIEGDPVRDDATISIVDRGGVSRGFRSRVDGDPYLRGTKHRVAVDREVLITKGLRDERVIALVPEVKDTQPVGITLLHLRLVDSPDIDALRTVLQSYQGRYAQLRDIVLETESAFDEALLGSISVEDLLIEPVQQLAARWRRSR